MHSMAAKGRYRQKAEQGEEERKPQPVETTWAIGSMEWLVQQNKPN